jgi:hypothetical protein
MTRKRTKDLGTPELQAKRLLSVVNPFTKKAGDPNMSTSALGRLLEQGFLHPDYSQGRRMYDAGQTFLGLWRAVYPQKIGSTLGQFTPGGSQDLDPEIAALDLKSLTKYLGSRGLMDPIVSCVVYDHFLAGHKLEKLRTALGRVMEWQKQEKRIAA